MQEGQTNGQPSIIIAVIRGWSQNVMQSNQFSALEHGIVTAASTPFAHRSITIISLGYFIIQKM